MKDIIFTQLLLFSITSLCQWENQIPNYSFEKVTNGFPSPSTDGFNIPLCGFGEDSLSRFNQNTISKSLNFKVFGPYFLSSFGYGLEKEIKEKFSIQIDFGIAGHTGYRTLGWAIGPAMNQSMLIGKRFKVKFGFSEGIVFNPPSIRGKFDDMQSWDRPPRTIGFFSLNLGFEYRINKVFFINPDFNIAYVNLLKIEGVFPNEEQVRISGFAPSFGINLKIKI